MGQNICCACSVRCSVLPVCCGVSCVCDTIVEFVWLSLVPSVKLPVLLAKVELSDEELHLLLLRVSDMIK